MAGINGDIIGQNRSARGRPLPDAVPVINDRQPRRIPPDVCINQVAIIVMRRDRHPMSEQRARGIGLSPRQPETIRGALQNRLEVKHIAAMRLRESIADPPAGQHLRKEIALLLIRPDLLESIEQDVVAGWNLGDGWISLGNEREYPDLRQMRNLGATVLTRDGDSPEPALGINLDFGEGKTLVTIAIGCSRSKSGHQFPCDRKCLSIRCDDVSAGIERRDIVGHRAATHQRNLPLSANLASLTLTGLAIRSNPKKPSAMLCCSAITADVTGSTP